MENFDWGTFFFYAAMGWVALKIFDIYLGVKNKQLEREIKSLQERIENRVINVKVEKHGDMFYLFDKRTDSFVAQGRTMEEVTQHVDSRFKGAKVVLANQEELSTAGLK